MKKEKKMDFNKVYDRKGTSCSKWDYTLQEFGTDDVLPMWVADMDLACPPEVFEAMQKRMEHPLLGYTRYTPELLETIVKKMKDEYQWDIKPEWIVLHYNVLFALSLSVQITSTIGDEVLIQQPVYYPFSSLTKNSGRQPVVSPLKRVNDSYVMDFDHLEKSLNYSDLFGGNKHRIKSTILCNPHNPVGRCYTKEELSKFGEICLKNDIAIISDEIHADIIFKGHKHIPIASLSKELEQNTITCMSGGKSFNLGGMAISFTIIPNDAWRRKIKDLSAQEPAVLSMFALDAALKAGKEYYISELMEHLEDNYNYMKDYIESKIPSLKLMKQEATFLSWVDCSQLNMTRDELKDFTLNKVKIAADYGYIFGDGGEHFIRFNIAVPRSTLVQAMEKLESAVNTLAR